MDIKELKNKIENNTLSDDQMIWKIQDHNVWGLNTDESSWFIAKQYINEIAKHKGLTVKYISSWGEVAYQGFIEDDNLYVYKTEELKDYKEVKNSIIVCNKTDKDCITFPKLEAWQFIDFIQTMISGMNKVDLEWLATQYNFSMARETWMRFFRFYNDMLKISIFPSSVQESLFNELYNDGEYSTISNLTIFDLSNAIMKKDTKLALEVLKVFPYIDSKPDLWLLSILLGSFKRVIDIQLNPTAKAEDLGMSNAQYWAVKKNNVGVYNIEELVKIYQFLTKLEYVFKMEGLSASQLVDYMVVKILGGGI